MSRADGGGETLGAQEVSLRELLELTEKMRLERREESAELLQTFRQEIGALREVVVRNQEELRTANAATAAVVERTRCQLEGNGDLGLKARVLLLERQIRLVAWLAGPMLLSLVLGALGLVWALLTHDLVLKPAP